LKKAGELLILLKMKFLVHSLNLTKNDSSFPFLREGGLSGQNMLFQQDHPTAQDGRVTWFVLFRYSV
jgi:hypothetical protein